MGFFLVPEIKPLEGPEVFHSNLNDFNMLLSCAFN